MISDQTIRDCAERKEFDVLGVAKVANRLGITRQALHQRLQKLGIRHGFPRRRRSKERP